MREDHPNIGPGSHPFPGAKQTKAQRDEDAFMHDHGGWGERLIYGLVEALSFGNHATGRLPANALLDFRRDCDHPAKQGKRWEHRLTRTSKQRHAPNRMSRKRQQS